jgi:hypothetical protein
MQQRRQTVKAPKAFYENLLKAVTYLPMNIIKPPG